MQTSARWSALPRTGLDARRRADRHLGRRPAARAARARADRRAGARRAAGDRTASRAAAARRRSARALPTGAAARATGPSRSRPERRGRPACTCTGRCPTRCCAARSRDPRRAGTGAAGCGLARAARPVARCCGCSRRGAAARMPAASRRGWVLDAGDRRAVRDLVADGATPPPRPGEPAPAARVPPAGLTGTAGGTLTWTAGYDAAVRTVRLPRPARRPRADPTLGGALPGGPAGGGRPTSSSAGGRSRSSTRSTGCAPRAAWPSGRPSSAGGSSRRRARAPRRARALAGPSGRPSAVRRCRRSGAAPPARAVGRARRSRSGARDRGRLRRRGGRVGRGRRSRPRRRPCCTARCRRAGRRRRGRPSICRPAPTRTASASASTPTTSWRDAGGRLGADGDERAPRSSGCSAAFSARLLDRLGTPDGLVEIDEAEHAPRLRVASPAASRRSWTASCVRQRTGRPGRAALARRRPKPVRHEGRTPARPRLLETLDRPSRAPRLRRPCDHDGHRPHGHHRRGPPDARPRVPPRSPGAATSAVERPAPPRYVPLDPVLAVSRRRPQPAPRRRRSRQGRRAAACGGGSQIVRDYAGLVSGADVLPALGSGALPGETLALAREAVLLSPHLAGGSRLGRRAARRDPAAAPPAPASAAELALRYDATGAYTMLGGPNAVGGAGTPTPAASRRSAIARRRAPPSTRPAPPLAARGRRARPRRRSPRGRSRGCRCGWSTS